MHQIPNSLTFLRLILAFIYPFVPENWRIGIFILALLTEWADGFFARLLKTSSAFGAFLDPISDKAFLLSVAITTFSKSSLLWWQLLGIGIRDFFVLSGVILLLKEQNYKAFLKVKPRILGKITTFFQFTTFLVYLVWNKFVPELLTITITISTLSGFDYIQLLVRRNFYREYLSK